MRPAILATLLTVACAVPPSPEVMTDGDQTSMELALEVEDAAIGPPDGSTEQTTQTLDCPMGGTVQVHIRRTLTEEPYEREGYLSWRYDDCGTWDYGTIDGTASFSRDLEGGPPWVRSLRYNADLDYSGRSDGDCTAYVHLQQQWQTSQHRLSLPTTCPHPVREWWDMIGF